MRKIILLGLLLVSGAIEAAVMKDIHLKGRNHQSTIEITLSERVPYKHFFLNKPYRLVLDFENISSHPTKSSTAQHTRLVKSIRFGKQHANHTRMVLDIKHDLHTHFSQKQTANHFILTITLKHPLPKVTQVKRRSVLRDVIVMIDPGHGGKDPGATGQRGTQEKRVVLQIAKRLQRLINLTPGMKATLTRRGDYYIGLRQRLHLARNQKADIFVSIHADAFKNRASHGVSVFALSPRGATSEAARWLAEKENYSELGGVDLSELKDDSGLVRSVLIDLSQTATIGASLKLGSQLLKYLDDLASLHHTKVEQARFVVLKSPDIPSVLIETGFISNAKEERLLRSPWYQTKLANKILNGLKHYFNQYPPRDSYFSAQAITYRVQPGDSLSRIAARHRTSVSSIKRFNHLFSNTIHVGQKLKIPRSV